MSHQHLDLARALFNWRTGAELNRSLVTAGFIKWTHLGGCWPLWKKLNASYKSKYFNKKVMIGGLLYLEKIVRWVPFQICIQIRLYCPQQAAVAEALKDWMLRLILCHNCQKMSLHVLLDTFKMLKCKLHPSHHTFPYLLYFSSISHWPFGIQCCSQTIWLQRKLQIFYFSPNTQPQSRKRGNNQSQTRCFTCSVSFKLCKLTWTNKRLLIVLNTLSSTTVGLNSDHTLAADIRGITLASSSNCTSRSADAFFKYLTPELH